MVTRRRESSSTDQRTWWPVWVFAALLLIVLAVLLWQAPKIDQYHLRFPGFIIYLVAALLTGVALFGALHSYGKASGNAFGFQWEFGGAAALFLVVLLVGLHYNDRPRDQPNTLPYTFYTCTPGTKTTVKVDGRLRFPLANEILVSLNDGTGVTNAIPADTKQLPIDDAPLAGYDVVENEVSLTPGEPVFLHVTKRVTSATDPTKPLNPGGAAPPPPSPQPSPSTAAAELAATVHGVAGKGYDWPGPTETALDELAMRPAAEIEPLRARLREEAVLAESEIQKLLEPIGAARVTSGDTLVVLIRVHEKITRLAGQTDSWQDVCDRIWTRREIIAERMKLPKSKGSTS